MSERIKVARVAEIIGLTPRAVQKMATRIPSAARMGRVWTFREGAVRAWVRKAEEETWQKTSTDVGVLGGGAFKLPDGNYEKVYEQLIGIRQKSAGMRGRSRSSTPASTATPARPGRTP